MRRQLTAAVLGGNTTLDKSKAEFDWNQHVMQVEWNVCYQTPSRREYCYFRHYQPVPVGQAVQVTIMLPDQEWFLVSPLTLSASLHQRAPFSPMVVYMAGTGACAICLGLGGY